MFLENRAKTVAEAEAQQFTLPRSYDDGWRGFAQILDGYAISEELGKPGRVLRRELQYKHRTNPADLSLLEVRLLLFLEVHRERFVGGAKPYRRVEDLLMRIAEMTEQSYTPLTEEEILKRTQADMNELRNSWIAKLVTAYLDGEESS
jgi:hypothetical protein